MLDDDPRWGDDPRQRDDTRDRDPVDPRDAFVDKLDLPRGLERELVRDRDREYTLRGSESRTLSLVGSFRVVSSRDLSDHDGRPPGPTQGRPSACARAGPRANDSNRRPPRCGGRAHRPWAPAT